MMEDFMSPELAASLGMGEDSYGQNNDDFMITTKKKKSNTNKDEVKVTPAMIVEAKKMSKQQRKRLEQIAIRKEKEEMRSTYLQTLKEHAISAKEQELLQSVASIGQQVTHKQLLINSYKKHQAGIALTSEEKDILFEGGEETSEILAAEKAATASTASTATTTVAAANKGKEKEKEKDNRFVMKRKHLPVAVGGSAGGGSTDADGSAMEVDGEGANIDTNTTNMFSQSERKYARRAAQEEALQRRQEQEALQRKQKELVTMDTSNSVGQGEGSSDTSSESEDSEDEEAVARQIAAKAGGSKSSNVATTAPLVLQTVPKSIAPASTSTNSTGASNFGASMLAQFNQLKSKVSGQSAVVEGSAADVASSGAGAIINDSAGSRGISLANVETIAPRNMTNNHVYQQAAQASLTTAQKKAAAAAELAAANKNSGRITINSNFVAEVEETEMDRCDNTASVIISTGSADGEYVAKEGALPLNRAGVVVIPPSAAVGSATDPLSDKSGSSSTTTTAAAAGVNSALTKRTWRRVNRSNAIQTARMKLPICGLEQEIIECIQNHDVVILCGETGSGKTTQVPQFLYEAGYTCSKKQLPNTDSAKMSDSSNVDGSSNSSSSSRDCDDDGGMIVITQPRRVAAVATAERVASELGCPINTGTLTTAAVPSIVGYQIRHDSSTITKKNDLEDSTGASTRIKFVTDGVLLKEITTDLLLRQYSVVILDEAHERNVNTDILIGLLSRALLLRKKQSIEEMEAWENIPVEERGSYDLPIQPLKLVIMSATLRVHDFMQPKLFGSTISIASKEIPATTAGKTSNGRKKDKGSGSEAGVGAGTVVNSKSAATRAYITSNLKDPVNIPVITVESRQYPVHTHFARRTEINNYLDEVYKKTCDIHKKLPPGAVLVFLTGKREITYMYQKLNKAINGKKMKKRSRYSSVSSEIVSAKSDLFGNVDHTNDSDGENDSADEEEKEEEEEEEKVTGAEAADAEQPLTEYADDDAIFNLDEDDETGSGKASVMDTDDANAVDFNSDRVDNGPTARGEDISQHSADLIDSKFSTAGLEEEDSEGNSGGGDNQLREKMLREALGLGFGSTSETPIDTATASTTAAMSTAGLAAVARDDIRVAADADIEPPKPNSYKGAVILQLHAMMSLKDQNKVFDKVKEGYRLIVLATNVAETSITIPGVRYVVDCGRVKEKVLNTVTGVSKFEVRWVSKASAEQRKGRAGRVGPGHVYRLYSSAFFDQHMTLHAAPEILKTPLEDLILQMKSIGINNIESFPFPTTPGVKNMNAAIHMLVNVGALHVPGGTKADKLAASAAAGVGSVSASSKAITNAFAFFNQKEQILATSLIRSNVITDLGRQLVKFPIHPRLAKMLVRGFEMGGLTMLKYSIILVSMLSEKSPFVNKVDRKGTLQGQGQGHGSQNGLAKRGRDTKSAKGSKSLKRLKGKDGSSGKDDYDDSSEDSMDDSDDDQMISNSNNSGKDPEADSLHLEYHVYGDAIARLQGFYAFLHIISVTLVEMSGVSTMNNENLAKLLLNPRLRKWAAEQTSVQVFCNRHSLHLPTLTRCLELFAQLVRLSIGLLNVGSSVTNTIEFMTLVLIGNRPVRSTSRSTVVALGASANIIATQTSIPVLLALFLPCEDRDNDQQSSLIARRNATSTQGHSKHFRGSGSKSTGISSSGKSTKKATEGVITDELTLLRQVLLTGFCDCIAKRVPLEMIKSITESTAASAAAGTTANSGDARENANNGMMSRRRKMTAYMSCNGAVDQLLYLHPHSSLYENDVVLASSVLPEYVIYTDLLSNLKGDMTYLMCTSNINASWIGQCTRDSRLFHYSSAVPAPAPHYNTKLDRVQCYISPTYGAYNWPLPLTLISMSECIAQEYISNATTSASITNKANALTVIDTNSGFKEEEETYRWFLRLLLDAQFELPDTMPRFMSDIDAGNNSNNSNKSGSMAFKQLFRSEKYILPSTAVTTVPPPKRFRDIIHNALVPLIRHNITTKPELLAHLQGYNNGNNSKNNNGDLNMNTVPLIVALQPLFKPEFRQEYRQYWKNFNGAV